MKVFISLPMRGKSDSQIRQDLERVSEFIKDKHGQDVEILTSYDPSLAGKEPVYALGESIKVMNDADIAYFPAAMYENRGCVVEYNICDLYDIPTCHYPMSLFDDWLEDKPVWGGE